MIFPPSHSVWGWQCTFLMPNSAQLFYRKGPHEEPTRTSFWRLSEPKSTGTEHHIAFCSLGTLGTWVRLQWERKDHATLQVLPRISSKVVCDPSHSHPRKCGHSSIWPSLCPLQSIMVLLSWPCLPSFRYLALVSAMSVQLNFYLLKCTVWWQARLIILNNGIKEFRYIKES